MTHKQRVIQWLKKPITWAQEFGGKDFDPWSGQEELWEAYGKVLNAKLKRYQGGVLTPDEQVLARKMGISVMAGQGLGKERTIAMIGLHYVYILNQYSPKGVCTAPAGPTLHSTLWPEFGKVIAGSEILDALYEKQANRIFLKEDGKRGEFMRIEPRTIQQNSSPDEQAETLAGIHATGVIYLVTEASGVPEAVFRPLEGGLTDPLSLIILIFNPTRRTGFAIDSQQKNRQDWVCLQWSGRTLKAEKHKKPGKFSWFNDEAQDVLIRKYGEDSDFVRVRVDGLPPTQAADTLISFDSAMAAVERKVELSPGDPLILAVDVAGEGEDESIVLVMRGPVVQSITAYAHKKEHELSDIITAKLKAELTNLPEDVQYAIGVDYGGIGRSVYNHLVDIQLLRHVHRIDVSEKPLDPSRFHRLRDQVWWELREGFMEEQTPVIPNDDALIADLTTIKWGEVNGKIKIQGKGGSSGIPGVKPLANSPDRGDALCIGWYVHKHCVSRMPVAAQRRRRLRERLRQANWRTV